MWAFLNTQNREFGKHSLRSMNSETVIVVAVVSYLVFVFVTVISCSAHLSHSLGYVSRTS